MKCLVLAGGSSERLWPLSRKEYPKQFMELREGRSMFQETILRNIPFCDEFFIFTNKMYKNVARGQLQAFQGLEYRLILEETPLKTAPSVMLASDLFDDGEEILIVTTDCIIEGDYNTSVSKLKEAVQEDKFAVICCKPKNYGRGYNYIRNGKRVKFGAKPLKGCLWDTGVWAARGGVLREAFGKNLAERRGSLVLEGDVIKDKDGSGVFEPISLIKAVSPKNVAIIEASFEWERITDISSFYGYYEKAVANDKNTIRNNCKDVEIVNMADDRLIVTNGIKNVTIVNTRDAVYVTTSAREADIKLITNKYYNSKKKYFDLQPKKYESWGITELIGSARNCRVSAITVYPHEKFTLRSKKSVSLNLLVSQGRARVENNKSETDFTQDQNITISDSAEYTVYNVGNDALILICTERTKKNQKIKACKEEYLVKMLPVYKDNLWGGTKIRDVFGKDVGEMDVIAESWELSAHAAGQSRVAFGEHAGKTLTEYIETIGKERLGWKAQTYEEFPIMIKFIDAKRNLSVQVHPADEYAMRVEGEYGKNEMWHILDAEDGACIYIGFKRDVTAEELRERIANNTLMEVLNKIRVKKDETYFLKAGTVHAIGGGCFICEIQQSSNVTYRLYDYGRKDKTGRLRELHIEKALDVLDMTAYSPKRHDDYEKIIRPDFVKMLIGQCNYFTVNKYFLDGECVLPPSEASFQAIVVLKGEGVISDGENNYNIGLGDTWFCANKTQISLKGKCQFLAVNI